ncbi:MAG TPA: type II secretion system F family protein [Sedimentisphaerales bacterium]|nr:type II secretion system F family protein [Sedimentisphaerales bacterium]
MFENSSRNYESPSVAVEDREETQAFSRRDGAGGLSSTEALKKIQNFKVEFGPSRKDILNFTNQLAVMIRAGMSIQDSLESIASQCENGKFKAIIADLKHRIEEGSSFSQALAEHKDVFSNLYVNMVAAAEISGSLSSMLQKLAEYLDQEAETRSQVRGAMVYPIIIAVMAVLVVIFLLCFVLPRFTAIFAGKERLLPGPTKVLMAGSAFLRGNWFIIVPAIGGLVGGFLYFIRTNVGRLWWDKTKLTLPLLKTLCRSLYITRGLHTMGVLSSAGVPILDTIAITAQISGNVLYRQMWLAVQNQVRQGKKIASSLVACTGSTNRKGVFGAPNLMPSNVVQMIRSGEDAGSLSEVLRDVSEYYARELKTVIKTVTSMIEPIMIVLMGIMVGFIAMSIILPIFRMSSVIMSK